MLRSSISGSGSSVFSVVLCSGGKPELVIVLLFKGVECGGVTQGKADVVEPFEEAVAAEGIDGKLCFETVVVVNGLVFERDGETVAFVTSPVIDPDPQFFFGTGDGSNGYYASGKPTLVSYGRMP